MRRQRLIVESEVILFDDNQVVNLARSHPPSKAWLAQALGKAEAFALQRINFFSGACYNRKV